MINIYTDGSCYPNPGGPGGWAYVVVDGIKRKFEQSGFSEITTNNIMELLAIENALLWLRRNEVNEAIIYTDSQYSQKAITIWADSWKRKNWVTKSGSPVKNKELIQRIHYLFLNLNIWPKQKVKIQWVRGHNGTFFNEEADRLASLKKNYTKSYE